MNYKNVNDYEVLYLIEDENDSYKNILYDKYRPVVINLCNKYINEYNNLSIDREELFQEAFIGLDYAISHFDFNKDVKFITYCMLCIESKIKDYFNKLYRKKNLIHINSVSLDDTLVDYAVDSFRADFINEEEVMKFKNSLNDIESWIFELRFNGFTCKEIAFLLDLALSSIYFYLKKIKSKYNKIFCL